MSINYISALLGVPMGGATPQDAEINIALEAKKALYKGTMDGGPVNPVKTTSDRSGRSGSNDYYTILGYDA